MVSARSIRGAALGLVLALTLGLAACGGDSEPAEESAAEAGSQGPITITHEAGETELPSAAKRVVTLEWEHTEDLLAIGLAPVGAAEIEGYGKWVDVETDMLAGAEDVGTRQEPSLEAIAALQPDLIVAEQERHRAIYDELSNIAPTVLFSLYPADASERGALDGMRNVVTQLGTATGRADAATQALDHMDQVLADAAQQLEDAGAGGTEYLLVQGFSDAGSPVMRVYLPSAWSSQVVSEAGLTNAWEGKFDRFGFTTISVEGLTKFGGDVRFFYVTQPEDDVIAGNLADSAAWKTLDFVAADHVYALDPATWFFGGPLSAEKLAQQVAASLTS